jgi:hypothetical protein
MTSQGNSTSCQRTCDGRPMAEILIEPRRMYPAIGLVLLAASVTVGIGEWLVSSYYLGVLSWGEVAVRARRT